MLSKFEEYKKSHTLLYFRATQAQVLSESEECAKAKLLLEEEKRKNEDLQFTLEEQQILG